MPINVNTRYNNGRNISPSESTRQRIMNNISHNSNNNSNNIPDLPEASFNDVLDLSSSESPDTRESQRGCLSNPITSIINFFRNLNNRRELPVQQPNTQANTLRNSNLILSNENQHHNTSRASNLILSNESQHHNTLRASNLILVNRPAAVNQPVVEPVPNQINPQHEPDRENVSESEIQDDENLPVPNQINPQDEPDMENASEQEIQDDENLPVPNQINPQDEPDMENASEPEIQDDEDLPVPNQLNPQHKPDMENASEPEAKQPKVFTISHILGHDGFNVSNGPSETSFYYQYPNTTINYGNHKTATQYDSNSEQGREDKFLFKNIDNVEIIRTKNGNYDKKYNFKNSTVRVKRSNSIDVNNGQIHVNHYGNMEFNPNQNQA